MMNSITEMSNIEDLMLTVRTTNALKCEGIYTVGKLVGLSVRTFLKTPNIGRRALTEVCDALAANGLCLIGGGKISPERMASFLVSALPIHPTERDRERFRDAAKQNMTWCDFNRTGVDGDYKDPETRNLFKLWWAVERERQLLRNLNQSQGSKLSEWARRYEAQAAEVERLNAVIQQLTAESADAEEM